MRLLNSFAWMLEPEGYNAAAIPPRPIKAPKNRIRTIIPKNEITVPAMARPRGALNNPISENIVPSSHNTKSRMGIQQRTSPNRARTKPAVPMPFFLGGCCMNICCW